MTTGSHEDCIGNAGRIKRAGTAETCDNSALKTTGILRGGGIFAERGIVHFQNGNSQ